MLEPSHIRSERRFLGWVGTPPAPKWVGPSGWPDCPHGSPDAGHGRWPPLCRCLRELGWLGSAIGVRARFGQRLQATTLTQSASRLCRSPGIGTAGYVHLTWALSSACFGVPCPSLSVLDQLDGGIPALCARAALAAGKSEAVPARSLSAQRASAHWSAHCVRHPSPLSSLGSDDTRQPRQAAKARGPAHGGRCGGPPRLLRRRRRVSLPAGGASCADDVPRRPDP